MTETLYKIALECIERYAHHVTRGAQEISHYVRTLTFQRSFETKAEAAIEDAEKALIQSLNMVRAAKASYQALPKEKPNDLTPSA